MNGGIIFAFTFIVLWCFLLGTGVITAHFIQKRDWGKQCEKENALSASTQLETTTRKTNTAQIAQKLVNLDHALMEMTANEVLRVRTREEPQAGDHRRRGQAPHRTDRATGVHQHQADGDRDAQGTGLLPDEPVE